MYQEEHGQRLKEVIPVLAVVCPHLNCCVQLPTFEVQEGCGVTRKGPVEGFQDGSK